MARGQVQPEESKHNFFEEDVEFRIPAQEIPVTVRRKVAPLAKERSSVKGASFEIGRLVLEFEFVGEGGATLSNFEPPIEIAVRYTEDDLNRAKAANKTLELWYFNGGSWKQLTEAQHKFRLLPDRLNLININAEPGGYGVAYITDPSDPAVGWNP